MDEQRMAELRKEALDLAHALRQMAVVGTKVGDRLTRAAELIEIAYGEGPF
ncbi:hypothetical protein QZM97_02625 [Burkholderia orbicola]|uniref:hypothetical protein n=1 Tax=Burkholderia orbicola TaxID=2978683 RepID=UPI00264E5E46|nr:hypothetical protein [Burkholderia orbicola]MDN7988964.1 hypothetical protein [Burkholderia orbicola]